MVFVQGRGNGIGCGRSPAAMDCRHQGFHTVTSRYDHSGRVLVFLRECEACGAQLAEELRLAYEPRLDPRPAASKPDSAPR